MQNDVAGQDTALGTPEASMTLGVDHVVPLKVSHWPAESTTMQKVGLTHEIELGAPEESMGVGVDQLDVYVHSWPLAPSAMQLVNQMHDTDVSRVEAARPSVAFALPGFVRAQAPASPATMRRAARARSPRARDPNSRRLFESRVSSMLPPSCPVRDRSRVRS